MRIKLKLYKLKRIILNSLKDTKPYFYYLIKSRKPKSKRVVIFAQGRTGSTLLEDLLCSTSHFKKRGELLAGKGTRIRYPYQYITGLTKIKPKDNFIFHLKIYHLTRDRKDKIEPSYFLKRLQKKGWKIIYLRRKNKLNHFLSNLVAEKRGYAKFDNKKEKISLHLDPIITKKSIEERAAYDNYELNSLEDLEYLKITYEDDLQYSNNHQNTVNKILDYLDLERKPCFTKHRKVNTAQQKDLIRNYNEIIKFLKEEKLAKYID